MPIPRASDGRVLTEALIPELAHKPPRYEEEDQGIAGGPGSDLSPADEAAIRARLQGLGYVA